MLRLYRRGTIWHYRGSVAGRRLRGSAGTAQKEIAEQIIADIEARAWRSHTYGPESVLTFAQAAIKYRQARKSARFLQAVEDYWRDTPVKDITPGAIRQCALDLYPDASGATRNRQAITPTQAVINHAASLGLCRAIKAERFAVETRARRPVTREWVEAFMAHASPHLGALAMFMFGTGARISEALAVSWDDVDLARARALIRQTKTGAERVAHLPGPVLAAIANIPGERSGKVFRYGHRNAVKSPWGRAVERAGIEKLSPHCCRHGFATAMLHAGVDPVTVANRGGWKSAQHVFATYGHPADDKAVTDRIFDTPGAQSPAKQLKKQA